MVSENICEVFKIYPLEIHSKLASFSVDLHYKISIFTVGKGLWNPPYTPLNYSPFSSQSKRPQLKFFKIIILECCGGETPDAYALVQFWPIKTQKLIEEARRSVSVNGRKKSDQENSFLSNKSVV